MDEQKRKHVANALRVVAYRIERGDDPKKIFTEYRESLTEIGKLMLDATGAGPLVRGMVENALK